MAGDWLKVEKVTPNKSEMRALARTLGISRGDAFLACFNLWSWADAESPDGHVLRVTDEDVDEIAGFPGFSCALRDVGWLEARSGSLLIPHFDRHMGQSAKTRTLAKDRQRMSRAHRDKSVTREEKRREESLPSSSELPSLPEEQCAHSEAQEHGTDAVPGREFETTAPGLAQAWAFHSTLRPSHPDRDVFGLTRSFAEMLRQGVPGERILAEILSRARNRNEPFHALEKRLLKATSAAPTVERLKRLRAQGGSR